MTTTTKLLAEGWKSYRAACIPTVATPGQLYACRYAFMGGASLVLRLLLAIGEPTVSDDAGDVVIESLRQELDAFARGEAFE